MSELAEIIARNEEQIRSEWIRDMSQSAQRADLISRTELGEQCDALLKGVVAGVRSGAPTDVAAPGWRQAREFAGGDLRVARAPGLLSDGSGDLRPFP